MDIKKDKKIILEIKNLSLNYHTLKSETAAIKNMNLDIYDKEFLSIVGPSGCGKSTFLSLVAGLISASGGKINLKNFSFSEIGYMFQRDCLFPWKSIKENALLGLEIKRILNKKSESAALDLLKKYDLKKFENYYPNQLSGGMRQKVALIRTLAINPRILLLDEPFSALDYQTRIDISEQIRNIIKNEKKTAVLVTHDISEAICLSDRVAIFSKRPSKIKKIFNIDFGGEAGTFHEKRRHAKFNEYFDKIWSELKNEDWGLAR